MGQLFRLVAPQADKIDRNVVREAALWMARLQAGHDADAEDACRRWREAAAAHELAWQRLNGLGADLRTGLQGVGEATASATLRESRRRAARRGFTKGGLTVLGAGLLTWQVAPPSWLRWTADQSSGVGERRAFTLDDGTRVVLNTDTAIDVRYGATKRQIELRYGEMLIETAKDAAGRPFEVLTGAGRLTPVGTRFVVRDGMPRDGLAYQLTVLDGAVDVMAPNAGGLRIQAGQRALFGKAGVDGPVKAPVAADAWVRGMMVADGMPLRDFLRELGRYRHGFLRCAPEIAQWQVVGAYSLDNTDAALTLLTEILPVRIERRTNYWVTVAAR
ncbi:hypothetical protein ASB57_16605 [Bordetella sp. N]|nr:hypothetical protein ASB57_16605 [Bordetella sp. N]